MTIQQTPLNDCFLLKPAVFRDARGLFCETFHKKRFEELTGLNVEFVQDNQSISSYGVLRGLHYQTGQWAMAKLVRAAKGRVLDIVVDLRKDSSSFGQSFAVELSEENGLQLFVPRGFAHGFITLSEESVFCYKCDNFYHQPAEGGIRFDDATLGLDWHLPKEDFIISEKDLKLPGFLEVTQ